MDKVYKNVQIEKEYHDKLKAISAPGILHNSMTNVVETLIDQEYARIFSQPQPVITIADAVSAEEAQARC